MTDFNAGTTAYVCFAEVCKKPLDSRKFLIDTDDKYQNGAHIKNKSEGMQFST
jgi:hypothetical protein